MNWSPFKKNPNNCLGIDIGTSSIKMAEVRKRGNQKELENYAEIEIKDIYPDFKRNILSKESEEIALIVRALLKEAKTKTKAAIFSLPDYSSFFINFTLPFMTREEIPEAVKFEAPIHIPLPLSKVALDWQIVEAPDKRTQKPIKILAVAVPNEIVDKYKEIASLARLDLVSLEAEVFGLIRTLVRDKEPTVIIDIGQESTTCSIVDKKILKVSHSFDLGSRKLVDALMKGLNVDYRKAEKIKKKEGLLGDEKVKNYLIPIVDNILRETNEVCNNFLKIERREIKTVILSGGGSLLSGLKEYFEKNLNFKIETADPFRELNCPEILSGKLEEMGPFYAVSIGMALRGLGSGEFK